MVALKHSKDQLFFLGNISHFITWILTWIYFRGLPGLKGKNFFFFLNIIFSFWKFKLWGPDLQYYHVIILDMWIFWVLWNYYFRLLSKEIICMSQYMTTILYCIFWMLHQLRYVGFSFWRPGWTGLTSGGGEAHTLEQN